MTTAVTEVERGGGSRREACRWLGAPRATYERQRRPAPERRRAPRPPSPRALTAQERQAVVEVLNSPRFVDQPPAEIYPRLLDEGVYLCSPRTMYRLLQQEEAVGERRAVRRHPPALVPSASAAAPNQVWVWDITKLRGPVKWVYFSLYVILDLFSRFIVGWLISPRESSGQAKHLIRETCRREGIEPKVLTLHSDRGSPMTSKTVAQLLVDLDVDPSFSRPRVSDDNAFAEASFKTLKYQPEFPDCFGSIEEARTFIARFVAWYNDEHYHSGLRGLTPASVHQGAASAILARRQELLDRAHRSHPERFVNGPPLLAPLPERVYLVPPAGSEDPREPTDQKTPGRAVVRPHLVRTSDELNVPVELDKVAPAAFTEPGRPLPGHTHPLAEGLPC